MTDIDIVDGTGSVKASGLECPECGVFFRVKKSHLDKRKCCSRLCASRFQSRTQAGVRPKGFVEKEKPWPHTRVRPAKKCGHITKNGRNYCPRCRLEFFSEIKEKPCMICGKAMILSLSQYEKYKCCSLDCRNIAISNRQKGELSHLWKGGITDENRRLRNSAEYDDWRKKVFERDDYTCVTCGTRGGKLCADHIKEWSLYPMLRFDLENGRTMCYPCHQKTDNFGGKMFAKILELEKNGELQLMLL